MAGRVILGKHPLTGPNGIFVTRSGFEVQTADPDNVAHAGRFAVNTRWAQQANIIQAGTCAQGATVSHTAIGGGHFPYILFHRLLGSGYYPHEIMRNVNNGNSIFEHISRWRLEHLSATSFRINVRWVNVPDNITGAQFKYVIFNCPVR